MRTSQVGLVVVGCAMLASATATARAQSTEPAPLPGALPTTPTSAPEPTAVATHLMVPAGTPLVLRLETALNSRTATTGQKIAFTVAHAYRQDGREVIPAGTPGEGEVTHAAKASWGGKPGELMLAARRLQLSNGVVVRLRSSLGMVGADTTGEAIALSIFTPLALGAFLSGREIDLPAGAFFAARTAETLAVPANVESAPDPAPASPSQP